MNELIDALRLGHAGRWGEGMNSLLPALLAFERGTLTYGWLIPCDRLGGLRGGNEGPHLAPRRG
ncbi:MAG: hypothetical protein ACREDK_03260, partial [Thermoplasmata archaeon]